MSDEKPYLSELVERRLQPPMGSIRKEQLPSATEVAAPSVLS
ncbi:MAG: hypothetical protein AAGJ81_13830 [Verrucomicrobiota bacterium]